MANFPGGNYVMVPQRVITNVCVYLSSADPAGSYPVPAPKNSFGNAVRTWVKTAGTNATLTVGDSASAIAVLTSAEVAPATPGTTKGMVRAEDNAQAKAKGWYYTADDKVIFAWNPNGDAAGEILGQVDLAYPALAGIVL